MGSDGPAALRELRDALKSPIEDIASFTFQLSSTLNSINLHPHPTSISVQSSKADPALTRAVARQLPSIQIALLTTHVPTFLPSLDTRERQLLQALFVPPRQSANLALRRAIALTTYSTLGSLLSTKSITPLPRESRSFVLKLLADVTQYGVGDVYWAVWSSEGGSESSKEASARSLEWDSVVTALIGLPGKVGNAVGRWKAEGWTGNLPDALSPKMYFDKLSIQLESLLYEISQTESTGLHIRPLLERLYTLGLFSSTSPDRLPSFWTAALPATLAHLHPEPTSPLPPYPDTFLPRLLESLSASAFAGIVESLLEHLSRHVRQLEPETKSENVKRASTILEQIIGKASAEGQAIEVVTRAVMKAKCRTSDSNVQFQLRVAATWADVGGEAVVKSLLNTVIDAWTDPKYIRYVLYSQQFALTYMALLLLSTLPPFHPHLITISHRGRFLSAMQSYLGHPDPSIRRLGMLVAEVVSERTTVESGPDLEYSEKQEIEELQAGLEGDDAAASRKPRGAKCLKFGATMWDGHGEGKDEARWLRLSVGVCDRSASLSEDHRGWYLGWDQPKTVSLEIVAAPTPSKAEIKRGRSPKRTKPQSPKRPKIVMLDDEQLEDTLEGYDLPAPSSRSPSPTPSYLEEIAADPSLALDGQQKSKIKRPVYISQLLQLVKDREKPDSLETALKSGEGLVRAKRSFGGELEENAENLAMMVVALNDPFNLDDFDERRQGLLNALVACAPRVVAPYLADVYFKGQFSLQQRSVILTALAMGARELAGMPVPLPASTSKIDFPSRTLPPSLHRKYIADTDMPGQIEAAVDGIRGLLISKGARKGEETVPSMAREKRLRVSSKRTFVADADSLSARNMDVTAPATQSPVVPYKDVAAECFILPLINHFWAYYQDSMTRETRAKMRGDRYRAAGTGMILSPMALEKLLMTLTLMLHAARHSPLYLAVLVPESLELAITVAAQHRSSPALDGEDVKDGSKEGGVVGAALEVALVVLDASYELDMGRTLATSNASLLSAVGEWAAAVFKVEEGAVQGERSAGQGGMREGRLRSGAAGVVVKVSEIVEKWGRFGTI